MTRNVKAMLVALIPNGMFVCCLFGWMVGRVSAGEGPFPARMGAPVVMGLCATVPMLYAAASACGQRRDCC